MGILISFNVLDCHCHHNGCNDVTRSNFTIERDSQVTSPVFTLPTGGDRTGETLGGTGRFKKRSMSIQIKLTKQSITNRSRCGVGMCVTKKW